MAALRALPWTLTALSLLSLRGAGAVEGHHTLVQEIVVQTYGQLGEMMFQIDYDEIFYVHSPSKEVVWRLPDFETFASYDSQGALAGLSAQKANLEIMMKMLNRTRATNDPPDVMVFTENPMELGEPNVLICFMNKFFPPVIKATWLKNGERMFEGVGETDFYPNDDFSFRKFLYLTFIPREGDEYACSVDHWGQQGTVNKLWDAQVNPPQSEEVETLVCALGLAVGIIGIIAGTILIIKGMRISTRARRVGR
ncbi:mamu class II histocompatibility antigen, DR alpha chain-like [Lissotriton helveticus]